MTGAEEDPTQGLAAGARRRHERERRWHREGEPSMMRQVGQIGLLGWIVVAPTLLFLFVGRWLDHLAGTQIFFSAPLMMLGLAAGCWSAWRWMHRQ
ncbi:AtpZ/AtpI family protein [Acuticoccus sediminis]|uniref:AtpZ/AtpI family protein n=1 Tax=Acuticoccus sediminis TaxID=2184697 RepID=UPI001CFD0A4C|nr:AtpZ/AtpI family protein [Acuticoccus sediminis]